MMRFLSIDLGPGQPPLDEQLAAQGFDQRPPKEVLERFDKAAAAIVELGDSGILSAEENTLLVQLLQERLARAFIRALRGSDAN